MLAGRRDEGKHVTASHRRVLHTIGHSNHPIERFIALLKTAGIDLLVDVRSHPSSRFHPQFNRAALERALESAGIGYRWLGDRLGGKPKDKGLLDSSGHPDYARMSATTAFTEGIEILVALADTHAPAYMCAEENPLQCHRTRLVTPAVLARGARVHHLRGDGRVIAHEDLLKSERKAQPDLFG